jgi:hypothetical protein
MFIIFYIANATLADLFGLMGATGLNKAAGAAIEEGSQDHAPV